MTEKERTDTQLATLYDLRLQIKKVVKKPILQKNYLNYLIP